MPNIKVKLVNVLCRDTEDITGGDDFYLVGALVGGGVTKGILTHPIKIKDYDHQTKTFRPEESVLFEGNIPEGEIIKGGLKAYDEDAGKDWDHKYSEAVKEITTTVANVVAASAPYGAQAGKILDFATSIHFLASLDKDDLLGTTELEISATGPAHEFREWNMSKRIKSCC
ncbi:MAG: hypothetical protein ACRC62_18760 [Microcoleus sp.]